LNIAIFAKRKIKQITFKKVPISTLQFQNSDILIHRTIVTTVVNKRSKKPLQQCKGFFIYN